MKSFLKLSFIVLAVFVVTAAAHAVERITYEYASFSSMGTKSSIIWPDGSVLRLEDKFKRPGEANEKMFYVTMALNVLAQRGYEPYVGSTTPMAFNAGHEDDLIFRRVVAVEMFRISILKK
jgi:hypothetical protein